MADQVPQVRPLDFPDLDAAIAEVERLVEIETVTVGQFSHGQIIRHLAITLDMVTGHLAGPKLPLPVRILGPLLKKSYLSKPLKPGFQLPKNSQEFFWPPEEISVQDAMTRFRDAIGRFKVMNQLPKHPIFGKLSREEHNLLQQRHIALHLGFVHPT